MNIWEHHMDGVLKPDVVQLVISFRLKWYFVNSQLSSMS